MSNYSKKDQLLSALKKSVIFIFIFWIIELIQLLGFDFGHLGIYPRDTIGLKGIIFAPFIHGDLEHLISNTAPFFVLSLFLFYFYQKRAFIFLILNWLSTGILTWIIGRESFHIGASGVIYALVTFLITGGILSRNWKLILVSVLVMFLYSGIMWGIFPSDVRISWEGHLSGAISGVIWAILLKKSLRSKP